MVDKQRDAQCGCRGHKHGRLSVSWPQGKGLARERAAPAMLLEAILVEGTASVADGAQGLACSAGRKQSAAALLQLESQPNRRHLCQGGVPCRQEAAFVLLSVQPGTWARPLRACLPVLAWTASGGSVGNQQPGFPGCSGMPAKMPERHGAGDGWSRRGCHQRSEPSHCLCQPHSLLLTLEGSVYSRWCCV